MSAKTISIAAPRSQEEAERMLFSIGANQRQIRAIEVRMNDMLAEARAAFEAEAQPLNAAIEDEFAALHAWAEANKDSLLHGKAKTVRLATGELSWRTSPPSVRVTKPEDVLERLRQLGLERFVRTKHEINKEAVLAEPDAVSGVKGISVMQKEEFVAKPFETEIEKATLAAKTEVRRAG